MSLLFCILDSCSVKVSENKYIIQKADLIMSKSPLLHQFSVMIMSKARAYLSEAPFMCSTLGRLLALPATIRASWKGLKGTNTLTYLAH